MVILGSSIFCVVLGIFSLIYSSIQIFNKRKKPFVILGIGSILTFFSFPFLINELYKFGSQTGTGYITLWETKDVLSFYGSFLAFLGTIALGSLALWQNREFKKENDLSQKRIEKINEKLLELESSREKEKLFERYFLFLDETRKLFDPLFVLRLPEEEGTEIEIFARISSCYSIILSIKRRLLFLDKPNSNNVFFQFIEEKTNEIVSIVKSEGVDKETIISNLFSFWKNNEEEYNKNSLRFIIDIYKSIFG